MTFCPQPNTPASHAGDHRSKASQGRQFRSCEALPKTVMQPPQSSQRSGESHTLAPPRAALGTATISPPCSSLWISLVKKPSWTRTPSLRPKQPYLIIQACVGGVAQQPSASPDPSCAGCRASTGVQATVRDQGFRADPILAQAVSWTARIPVRCSSNRD